MESYSIKKYDSRGGNFTYYMMASHFLEFSELHIFDRMHVVVTTHCNWFQMRENFLPRSKFMAKCVY